jgi:hypothetical protein
MTEVSRGPMLSTFAVLFAILALSNLLSRFILIQTRVSYSLGLKRMGSKIRSLVPPSEYYW